MCGICGIVDFSGRNPDRETVESMMTAIRHRGPDAEGMFVRGAVGLGHKRLTIIDLSERGNQPMFDETGRYAIIYNGETYNFRELREALAGSGVQFKSRTDAEVVLQAYIHWGEAAFKRLNGMFACAIWDDREQSLIIVRDRYGIKPVYYAETRQGIVFGSEIKAIIAAKRVDLSVNWAGLHEFLYYDHAIGDHTMFREVKRLRPGHVLTLDTTGIRIDPFYSLETLTEISPSFDEAVEHVRRLLDAAVKRHLIADVPVSVFLSGGIDSSAMVAYAADHYGGRLQTFSAGFDFDTGVNETEKAAFVAKQFGTDHNELHIAGADLPRIIESLVASHDEPFGDPADIPLKLMCHELNGRTKVVLQGDGGDELFAGYGRYHIIHDESKWRLKAALVAPFLPLVPKSMRNLAYYRTLRMSRLLRKPDPSRRLALLLSSESEEAPPTGVFHPDIRERLNATNPFAGYEAAFQQFRHLDPVQRILYIDTGIILPDGYFEKVDKSTMSESIESRVPFLDTDLAEYVMRLPSRFKLHKQEKKYLLRTVLRGKVPDSILDAPKTGFSVPIERWLAKPLAGYMREVLLDGRTAGSNLFDIQMLGRMVDEHTVGVGNHGMLLYRLLVFALWHEKYLC